VKRGGERVAGVSHSRDPRVEVQGREVTVGRRSALDVRKFGKGLVYG